MHWIYQLLSIMVRYPGNRQVRHVRLAISVRRLEQNLCQICGLAQERLMARFQTFD